MADEADIGNDYMEKWLSAQLEEHAYQLSKSTEVINTGRCKNCEDKLDDGRPYCDEDCRDDFDTRQRAEKRRGRA